MPDTYLITGATGFQGGATARELLARGFQVNALVRDPFSSASQQLSKLGATLFKGDFDDVSAIKAATSGVTGVFLNPFPSFTDPGAEVRCAKNFVAAAKEAGTVTSFVVSTVFKSKEQLEFFKSRPDEQSFMKLYLASKAGVEDVILASGIRYVTILRPTWLHYQYLSPYCKIHFPDYEHEHSLTISYPVGYKKGHFDPEDVGKFATAAFSEPEKFAGRTIELVNEVLTFEEVAGTISKVSELDIGVKYRSEEETKEAGKTMPIIQLQVLSSEMRFDGKKGNLDEFGIQLSSLEDFLRREKERLRETLVLKSR